MRMWIRAKFRQAPPTALNDRASKRLAIGRRWRSMAARTRAGSALPRSPIGERPQRQGDALAGLPIGDPRQLQAGAAEVADDPGGVRQTRQNAQGGIPGLLFAGEHPQIEPRGFRDAAAEGFAVGGLAHRGRGRGEDLIGLGGGDQHAEPGQGVDGRRRTVGRQTSGDGEIAPQPREHLLVVDGPDRPPLEPIEHEAHGIAADIDDRGVAVGRVTCVGRHSRTRGGDP